MLYFVFLFRLILLPEEEYSQVPERTLLEAKKKFYQSYQRALGEEHCVFNVHLFAAHAEKFRCNGPATSTSCFAHERLFEKFRRLAVKGTLSIGKQILKGACKAAVQCDHVCSAAIKILPKAKDTPQSCSSVFYTYQEPIGYQFYECQELDQDGNYRARRIQVADFKNRYGIEFGIVGVFKSAGVETAQELITKSTVKGFAIRCENLVVTVPHNTITEL